MQLRAAISIIPAVLLTYFLAAGPAAADGVPAGSWRAVVEVPGGELPFLIHVEGEQAFLINGAGKTRITDVRFDGAGVTLSLPTYNSRIEARHAGGIMSGTLTLTKRGGVEQVMPFSARHGQTFRFFENAAPSIDVSGKWAVSFLDDKGEATPSVGAFEQKDGRLTGTFLTTTGDYRFLAGDVQGNKLYLSCFDGGHAFLFIATLDEVGMLHGDFWSGTQYHRRWIARRNDAAALPDPYTLTFLKEGHDRLSFRLPRPDGVMVSLDDQQFQGKVVLVVIAGTWCPNCHDEARFLSRYYNVNAHHDLAVVGLMYEHYREFDKAARQVERFKTKYDIQFDLLVAGYSDKKEAGETLPTLNHVLSYPTMIFIDRKGAVRAIHTGFNGPATGAHYNQFIEEFKNKIDLLLSEQP